jgi:peptidoglycan/xylan/chitin deacetylase (PgdA/CDA1 family)
VEDTAVRWPKETKVAVCLTGDIDRAWDLADGRLERILEVLDKFGIKCTFPVCGQVFSEDPDCIEQIISHSDEIAGHGDIHKGFRGQSHTEQKRRIEETMKIIREHSGIKINGFRAPDVNMDMVTLKVADELGLSYDSSHMIGEAILINFRGRSIEIRNKTLRHVINDSIEAIKEPSRCFTLDYKGLGVFGSKEDNYSPFNPISEGQKLGIVEIPMSYLDDYGIIEAARIKNWKKTAEIWKRNFDYYYEKKGLYVLDAHPRRVGMKEYIGALKSFLEYAVSQENVWFPTLTELATWWKKNRPQGHT